MRASLLSDGRPAILRHVLRVALNEGLRICEIGLNLSIDDSFSAQLPMRDGRGQSAFMPRLQLIHGKFGQPNEKLFESFVDRLVNTGHISSPSGTELYEARRGDDMTNFIVLLSVTVDSLKFKTCERLLTV